MTSTDAGRIGAEHARRAPIRLAVLDDHEVLLDSLASWIATNARDFELVLTASNWLQLVHSDRFPTDLVLLDFQLREPVSIEARIRTCRAAGAKVVVLTSLDGAETRQRALAAGADAFLTKDLPMREVMEVARSVMLGDRQAPQNSELRIPADADVARPRLSAGEAHALQLYATGLTTNQVAESMNVQYETAKTYLRRVREKYAKVNRPASRKSELVRRAAEDGYLS